MSNTPKLSIIMPVYNEKETVLQVIERVKKAWENYELLIVDDGSSDGTKELLKKINEKKIIVLSHTKNQGKGAAIKTALEKVTGEYVIIQDADLEYDPQDYTKLMKPIIDGKAEIVYGSRFTGEHRNLLFWHWVGNQMINFLVNILYNSTISDLETGYKVFKTDILKSIKWSAKRFDFETEITTKILKRKIYIYEVPISYVGRDYSEGKKIGLSDAFMAFWTILKFRFVN